MYKKYTKSVLLGLMVVSHDTAVLCAKSSAQDAGKERMSEIMHHGPDGLHAGYKALSLVDMKNLATDLNSSEINQLFDCQTAIGTQFLGTAFDNLISTKDNTNVIGNRQQALKVLHNDQIRAQFKALLEQAAQHEAVVAQFLQNKQDVLDKLPKSYAGQASEKSFVMQALHQAKWAALGAWNAFCLYKVAPYHQYYYKTPEELAKAGRADLEAFNKEVEQFVRSQEFQQLDPVAQQKIIGEKFGNKDLPKLMLDQVMCNIVDSKTQLDEARVEIPQEIAKVEEQLAGNKLGYFERINYQNHKKMLEYNLANLDTQQENLEYWTKVGYGTAYSITAATVGILAYSTYKLCSKHMQGLQARDFLYSINQLIVIAEKFELLCAKHGIQAQFAVSGMQDVQSQQLINTLKSYPYNTTSMFVPSSLTRTFVYEVYEKEMYLAPVFAAIAEIDALYAVADSMVATQGLQNGYCYAQFIDNNTPMIEMDGFWNVLVSNAVANDLHTDCKVILTGPNAGGKSTAIRAILQNIMFAQTFGIAAAQHCALTQFDVVHSFINVSDDILQGKSLFATEMQRAQDILYRMKTLKTTEKYFFALDELFTGTNAVDGEICACSFIDNIAQYQQAQFIYATHFDKLKDVGANHPQCVNYKIDAPIKDDAGQFIRNAQGQLVYPYTLSLGANDISVAQVMAADAGVL